MSIEGSLLTTTVQCRMVYTMLMCLYSLHHLGVAIAHETTLNIWELIVLRWLHTVCKNVENSI